MASTSGQFMGKLTFMSAGAAHAAYLSVHAIRVGPGQFLYFPALIGASAGATERCAVYQQSDDSLRVQMGNGLWIGLDQALGNLTLAADAAGAVGLRFGGAPWGQGWQALVGGDWLPVVYFPETSVPLLTINSAQGDASTFAPAVVTPSLAAIVASRSAPGADLTQVMLDGAVLAGADLSGADFSGASLRDADLSACSLEKAIFRQAALGGVCFDGARLDGADMTGATLAAPGWGAPASAKGLVLAGCQAAGAVLGGQASPLDCSGANLSAGTFTGADLSGLILAQANLGRANLAGCSLAGATLDGADLTGVLAPGANFKAASLRNVRAHGANFVRADLSAARLGQAQMGAKSFLFKLAAAYAADLQAPYPDQALQAAFAQNGVTLWPQAPIAATIAGSRWQIADPAGPYLLILNGTEIDVFLDAANPSPAILRAALCLDTQASGASLGGADLRGVRWFGSKASLDHADLEGAALAGSLLASIDLTQAFLSGADLSDCVLVQARMAGCTVNAGASGQAFSLEGAQLQGCDFGNTTLLSGLLVDAGVALAQGVPLFSLPSADADKMTPAAIATLAGAFGRAGYPIGAAPGLQTIQTWNIDNGSDPNPADPASYIVKVVQGQPTVFDGGTGAFLFTLPASALPLLANASPPPQLVSDFDQAGYGLAANAAIANGSYWQVAPSAGAGIVGPYGYSAFRVVRQAAALMVFGAGTLLLRDWPQYPAGLAFQATSGLPAALSAACVGPAGYPAALAQSGQLTWQAFFTAGASSQGASGG